MAQLQPNGVHDITHAGPASCQRRRKHWFTECPEAHSAGRTSALMEASSARASRVSASARCCAAPAAAHCLRAASCVASISASACRCAATAAAHRLAATSRVTSRSAAARPPLPCVQRPAVAAGWPLESWRPGPATAPAPAAAAEHLQSQTHLPAVQDGNRLQHWLQAAQLCAVNTHTSAPVESLGTSCTHS